MGKSSMVAKTRTSKRKLDETQDIEHGGHSNDVNKLPEKDKNTKKKEKEAMKVGKRSTPVKKKKLDQRVDWDHVQFVEDDEYVSYTIEGQDDFNSETEEGEIADGEITFKSTDADGPVLGECSQSCAEVDEDPTSEVGNFNGSASIDIETYRERKRKEKQKEDKEMAQVTKRIAGETFALVKDMMQESGLFEAASLIKSNLVNSQPVAKGPSVNKKGRLNNSINSDSEMTIYERAVLDQTGEALMNVSANKEGSPLLPVDPNNRLSSSSEEPMDMSDKNGIEMGDMIEVCHDIVDQRGCKRVATTVAGNSKGNAVNEEKRLQPPQPSTSRCHANDRSMHHNMVRHDEHQRQLTPEEKADKYIRDAEAAKARIYSTPGKMISDSQVDPGSFNNKQYHSVMVDEDYL